MPIIASLDLQGPLFGWQWRSPPLISDLLEDIKYELSNSRPLSGPSPQLPLAVAGGSGPA